MKAQMEKVINFIDGFGVIVSRNAGKMLDQASFISSGTDLKIFINTNKSDSDYPKKMAPEQFVPSEDLKKTKSELRTRQILETTDVLGGDSDEEVVA